MASLFYASSTYTNWQHAKSFSLQSPPTSFKRPLACVRNNDQQVTRRSGNYPPSLWDDRYIQSLASVYGDELYKKKADKLKNDVRLIILQTPLDQLELIDDLQRLGVSYHFEDIVQTTLQNIFLKFNHDDQKSDLYNSSRQFRLFRDQGFHISQDVFVKFMDESGDFKQSLSSDTKGLLSLYEASYLSFEGETILDQARDFSTKHLVNNLKDDSDQMDDVLALQVTYALEVPLHWRMLRNQARSFVEIYEQRPDMNPILLELAKLDFNMVQYVHQKDVKIMSRWWEKTGLGQKLAFARDRLMENFLWTVGVTFEPGQTYCRQMLTKINVLITTIDDVYDVYGTLDELELFTDAVERWDMSTMDKLPDYAKICFLALFNSTNEMAYDTLKEHGYNPISHMKKAWLDLCKAYLLEAKWYYSGYKPTLDEYLNNAKTSIAARVILTHVYFFVTNSISKEALDCIETSSAVIRCSSLILRLGDDLGTSSDELKRGDVPKSIQCYMNDTGASEDEARAYIKSLIDETWKKMNKERFEESYHLSKTFIAAAMNLDRMGQFMYQRGDGHGVSNNVIRDQVVRLLVEPIRLD